MWPSSYVGVHTSKVLTIAYGGKNAPEIEEVFKSVLLDYQELFCAPAKCSRWCMRN